MKFIKYKNVIVIEIGGSYIGIKSCICMLNTNIKNKEMNVLFAHNFNQNYLTSFLKKIGNKKFWIIIISKSGATLEPSIAFEICKKQLIKSIGNKQEKNVLFQLQVIILLF